MAEDRKEIEVPEELRSQVAVTNMEELVSQSFIDKAYNWGRRNSVWPVFFGLACCAIEMIATASSRYDFARFGMEVMRASPRQADLIIVSGTVTKKMLPQIIRLYNQMPISEGSSCKPDQRNKIPGIREKDIEGENRKITCFRKKTKRAQKKEKREAG